MAAKLLSLKQPAMDTAQALAVVDSLRDAIASGQIKAFACVGISKDHSTSEWMACTASTTRLEMIGAMAHQLHIYEQE